MLPYNTSVHEATNFTPFEIVFGKIARTPSSFPGPEKLETYRTYLQELILRLSEIKLIATKKFDHRKRTFKRKLRSKGKAILRECRRSGLCQKGS